MENQHLQELRLKEKDYWWHVNRRRLVLDFLDRHQLSGGRILEVGCGGGLLSSLLLNAGADVVTADILTDAIRFAKQQGIVKGLIFDAEHSWPFAPDSFEVVIMLDVLEHINNDLACLHEVQRVLRRGGVTLLTVPAHPYLFSGWDKLLGHHRRYSLSRLRRIFRNVGLQPIILSYQNALSYIPALIVRRKNRILGCQQTFAEFPRIPEFLNRILKLWGRLESVLIPFKLPIGLSIFAVLKAA